MVGLVTAAHAKKWNNQERIRREQRWEAERIAAEEERQRRAEFHRRLELVKNTAREISETKFDVLPRN
jgi:uncharacterized protein YaiL (DUF2058 family)